MAERVLTLHVAFPEPWDPHELWGGGYERRIIRTRPISETHFANDGLVGFPPSTRAWGMIRYIGVWTEDGVLCDLLVPDQGDIPIGAWMVLAILDGSLRWRDRARLQ